MKLNEFEKQGSDFKLTMQNSKHDIILMIKSEIFEIAVKKTVLLSYMVLHFWFINMFR